MLKVDLKESPQFKDNIDDPEKLDFLVGVNWLKAVKASEGKKYRGIFTNPNIVCKLRDPKTLDFLVKEFQISPE